MKKTKNLYLGGYEGMEEKEIKQIIIGEYLEGETNNFIERSKIIIAVLINEDSYTESSFFLLKKDNKYYENYASHCSCHGFEKQFKPEKTTIKYLKSYKFNPTCNNDYNDKIKDFIINNIFE